MSRLRNAASLAVPRPLQVLAQIQRCGVKCAMQQQFQNQAVFSEHRRVRADP